MLVLTALHGLGVAGQKWYGWFAELPPVLVGLTLLLIGSYAVAIVTIIGMAVTGDLSGKEGPR